MIEYLAVGFGIGFLIGVIVYKHYPRKKEGIDTDTCVEYLRHQGYWVKLNRSPEGYKNER